MLRSVIPVLLLSIAGHALTKNDMVGFWKGSPEEDPSIKFEAFFSMDDQMETRGGGVALGLFPFESTAKGVWKVQNDNLSVKITSGWSTFMGQLPEADEPDVDYIASEAVYKASPKSLEMTDCDEEGECTTMVLTYVGAARQFTLREINGNTSIRRPALSPFVARPSKGRMSFRVVRQGQAFDLKGRSATLQNR